jgi:hypothetical protein
MLYIMLDLYWKTSSAGAQQTHRIFDDFQRMGEKHEDEWERRGNVNWE